MQSSHQQKLEIIPVTTAEQAVQRAAELLVAEITSGVSRGQTVLLLLSGGSATAVYAHIVAEAMLPDTLSLLKVGLVDERFGLPGHPESNEVAIRATGLIDVIQQRGGTFFPVLFQSEDGEQPRIGQVAEQYQRWLASELAVGREAVHGIAVVGMGPDGHTFGVEAGLSEAEFIETFPPERFFVGYQARTLQPPARLTITFWLAQQLDLVVGVVTGTAKQPVLRALAQYSSPTATAKFPASILTVLRGKVFTDQSVAG